MDANIPVVNPILVNAIEAIKNEITPETQDAYFKAVKDARFLSPVTIEPPPPAGKDGKTTLIKDTKISFFGFTDVNGDEYLPVYTDWVALKQWRDIPDEQTIITSYKDISSMVLSNPQSKGFVINPYSHNVAVLRNIIEHINAGPLSQWTVKEETKVYLGTPANDPVAIKSAVSKYLKKQKNVKSAYLALMEKDKEFSFLIVVDFVGDRNTTFQGIASAAVPQLKQGELIDMVPADSDIGEQVMHDFQPFYKRKVFGIF